MISVDLFDEDYSAEGRKTTVFPGNRSLREIAKIRSHHMVLVVFAY